MVFGRVDNAEDFQTASNHNSKNIVANYVFSGNVLKRASLNIWSVLVVPTTSVANKLGMESKGVEDRIGNTRMPINDIVFVFSTTTGVLVEILPKTK